VLGYRTEGEAVGTEVTIDCYAIATLYNFKISKMKKRFSFSIFILLTLSTNAQIIQVSEEQMFKAFKQDIVKFEGYLSMVGGGGNCASIALIKSAIGTFGINGVFKSVKVDSTNEMVYITRRDDKVIELTFDRLENAKEHFFITPNTDEISKKISDYGAFCFAVMCRAKQLNMGNDKKYFYRAIDNLNKGEAAETIYQLLGLQKQNISDLNVDNLKKYKNLVLYIAPHAVYSSSGNYDEFFSGTITGIEPLNRIGYFHCKSENSCSILGAYLLR
jgi:hypothetical protein